MATILSARALVLAVVSLTGAWSLVTAQPLSGGEFSIERSVIASGGGISTGGAFSLTGTVGQPEAGPAQTGGSFSLRGGFWVPVDSEILPDALFANSFEN